MVKTDKSLKETRAIELIKKHPRWTRDKVQTQLRKEFGSGIRYERYGEIRGDYLTAGAIGEHRKRRLEKEGFLPTEAKAYSGVALTSPLMQKYIRERRAMIKMAKEEGIPSKAITAQIRLMYRMEGHYKKGRIQPLERLVKWTTKNYGYDEAVAVSRLGEGALRAYMPKAKMRVYNAWRNAGFLPFEVMRFLDAKNWLGLLTSSPGIAARRERTRWVDDLQRRGWTNQQIKNEIQAYYDRDLTRSPWDFIRKYKPKRRKDMATYARAQEERAERLQQQTGSFYRGALMRGARRTKVIRRRRRQ